MFITPLWKCMATILKKTHFFPCPPPFKGYVYDAGNSLVCMVKLILYKIWVTWIQMWQKVINDFHSLKLQSFALVSSWEDNICRIIHIHVRIVVDLDCGSRWICINIIIDKLFSPASESSPQSRLLICLIRLGNLEPYFLQIWNNTIESYKEFVQ